MEFLIDMLLIDILCHRCIYDPCGVSFLGYVGTARAVELHNTPPMEGPRDALREARTLDFTSAAQTRFNFNRLVALCSLFLVHPAKPSPPIASE